VTKCTILVALHRINTQLQ